MHIDSSFTGTPLREFKTSANWRHMMNYAAAVNDPNDAYFNDERPDGIIAHPMFCAALTWPITERIGEYIDSSTFPRELIMTQVHFTEHLEIHRPVIHGDDLTIRGVIAAIQPHRAGTHVIIRFTAVNGEDAPVFTEHIGGLMRGVECRGGASGTEHVPVVPKAGPENACWESIVPVGPMAPFIYDGCTNIYFPIHTSRRFARQVGLPGIILQGTATLAFAVREIVDRDAAGDPSRIKKIGCKFTDMVMPGSKITIRKIGGHGAGGCDDIFFTVHNGEGRKAINNGYVQIKTK